MILLIDNYDSFSYNLYQFIGEINPKVKVIRNDELSIDAIKDLNPTHIVISPGPGRPEDAGICEKAIAYFAGKIPILGVCLGHQAICQVFGARIGYSKMLMHGKQSRIKIETDNKLFDGLPKEILVGRYHSLTVLIEKTPSVLKVIGATNDNEIMAIKHTNLEVYGVQFHPESILTSNGKKILENFLA